MHKSLPNTTRQAGKRYCQNDKVRITQRQEHTDHVSNVQGKVLCSFGFVHHPRLRAVLLGDQTVITDYACDCYEYNDNSDFCSHCAALAMRAFGEGELVYQQKAGLPGGSDSALEQKPEADRVIVLSDGQNDEGQRCVQGKVLCSFGFVHHPRLRLRASEVTDYACDCYRFFESSAFCPHCRALLTQVLGQDKPVAPESEAPALEMECPVPAAEPAALGTEPDLPMMESAAPEEEAAAPAAGPAAPEEKSAPEDALPVYTPPAWDGCPRTMRILFGHALGDGAPVCWYPNDTARIFHPNMGIIGTMGTGKTQLTKSLVTQLCRQQPNNFDGHPLGILIFDYKGDYNETKPDFVQAAGARVLKPYHLPFNPFSLQGVRRKPQLPIHTANAFTDIIARIYGLGPKQSATLLRCVVSAYQSCGIESSDPSTWDRTAPTFEQVYQVYADDESIKKNDSLYAAMDKLFQFQVLEGDPDRTSSLFGLLRGVVVIDLSGYDTDIQNLIVAITLELFYSQMQNTGSSQADRDFRQLTRFILVDEADNFMSQNFPALKRIMKEGREFGVGTILSTQFLRHFGSGDDDYSSYILTWVVHNVSDLKRSDIDFMFKSSADPEVSEQLYQDIKAIGKHQSIVKAGNAAATAVQDMPFWQIAGDEKQSYLPPCEISEA